MQLPSAEQTPTQQSRSAIEALEPSVKPSAMPRQVAFDWTAPDGQPIKKVYVQEQLGMLPTQEFGTRFTEIIEKFTQGEMGMKLGQLFRGEVQRPVTLNEDSVNDFLDENMAYVQAFIKLVKTIPDFELDIYCMSLGIPRLERPWAKEQLSEPPSRGGLTVDEGFELLNAFLRQNGELVRETLVGKAKELVETFMIEVMGRKPDLEGTATEKAAEPTAIDTPGGTPSSTTPQGTPESV